MLREEVTALLDVQHRFLCQAIDGLSEVQLMEIPKPMSNNIIWNLGHLVYSIAGLAYHPSGLPLPIPESFQECFRGGTSPSDWTEDPPVGEVAECFSISIPNVSKDLNDGKFDTFRPFELMPGITLQSIEQTLGFHAWHSGVHMGAVLALRKLIEAKSPSA